jgi:hypothetical protein
VGVPALGDTPSILGHIGKRVTFHDGDPLVGVDQHPGGEEPSQACPEDDGVVTELPHLAPLALCRCSDGRKSGDRRLRGNPQD